MPDLDNTVFAAIITAFVALLAPILVALFSRSENVSRPK